MMWNPFFQQSDSWMGSNDLTDAYAALPASQTILTTGIIHSLESGNVGGATAPLGEVSTLPVEPLK